MGEVSYITLPYFHYIEKGRETKMDDLQLYLKDKKAPNNKEGLLNYFFDYNFSTVNEAIKFFILMGVCPQEPIGEVNLPRLAKSLAETYEINVEWDRLNIKCTKRQSNEYSLDSEGNWHEGYDPFIGDVNRCFGETEEEAVKSLYVKKLHRKWDWRKPKRIGLITERTGYGKTTFIEEGFVDEINEQWLVWSEMQEMGSFTKKDILFITTRSSILEQQVADGDVVRANEDDFNAIGESTSFDTRPDKVRIILFQTLGKLYEEGKIKKMFPIIVIDEIHTLFDDTTFSPVAISCINCIKQFWNETLKFGLSATPDLLLEYVDPDGELFYILENNNLYSKNNTQEFYYCNYTQLNSLLKKIEVSNEYRAIVYCSSAKKAVEYAREYGGRFLLANDPEKYPEWYEEQQDLRDYVIKNKKLPDDVNIVFMTSAYREGFEFKDDRIKLVIIDACDELTITQFLGRVRRDVEKVIVVINESQKERIEKTIEEYEELEKYSKNKLIEYYGKQKERMDNKENQTLFVFKDGDDYKLNTLIKPIYTYRLHCYYQATNKLGNQIIKAGDRELTDSNTWFNSWLKDYCNTEIKRLDGKQEVNDALANWQIIYEYLGKRLYAEQKEELVERIGLWDYAHNRPCKAKRVKELLRENGFVVDEKMDGHGKRYWIISLA